MNRLVHGRIGVLLGPLMVVVALSGAVLAWRALVAPAPGQGSIGAMLAALEALENVTEIERIERKPTGEVIVHHYRDGSLVDQRLVGGRLEPVRTWGPFQETAQSLHRELFAGKAGRAAVGVTAGMMTLMCLTGLFLLVRRAGGWRALARPAKGAGPGRIHAFAAQAGLLPLMVVAATGVWMSLESFELIDAELPRLGKIPDSTRIEVAPAASGFAVFERPLDELVALTFPFPGDWFDVFVLQTGAERLVIDQANGAVLRRQPLPLAYRLSRLAYRLHSGEGLRLWAVIVGLSALAVPLFAATGGMLWWQRRAAPKQHAASAVTLFVGSENGTTWAFAHRLAESLKAAGQGVGFADLDKLAALGGKTRTALILTSTYGDGIAPANGGRVVDEVARIAPGLRYAVVGFGDRQFPGFCAHAERVDAALAAAGHRPLLPLFRIDQQSQQAFCDWAAQLGTALGLALDPPRLKRSDKTYLLTVREARRFEDPSGITAVLRFDVRPKMRYRPGDLVEWLPADGSAPRSYSIASSAKSGGLDLVVREHRLGLCSPMLCALGRGDTVRMVHKRSGFRAPASGPLIMLATGTGIAPFIGMIAEAKGRRITLMWGLRNREDDFPFRQQILDWQRAGRIRFCPCFSNRSSGKRLPELIRAEAGPIRDDLTIHRGAVMICGSLAAAHDIRAALAEILPAGGPTLEDLQRQKRHLEDVY